ncbi:hypothetical protein [Streptomyces sp. AM 2-1-1]|uniref:hypothetical protein n=1 Tax=Streptomyces sp. AM 2-1-1 TaxID=3028709 RepID=UPI0023B8C775|nr:hypothetical protein [Streptomyces sp. AM 2-1-1]WEH39618.1 hypothetical protein PZB77_08865 [Streptomyces sp. AM 2-1-1]
MREDGYSDVFAGDAARERRGPRHAAPRKSLLTKLNLPSGKKAFALAAMPTAVFMGMSLTPKLAMADDASDIPYAPGPCVTRSDEPSESPEPTTSASPSPSASASPSASPETDEDAGGTPTTTPSPSATSAAPAAGSPTDGAAAVPDAAAEAKSAAEPTPTASETTDPLDPLGVGDAITDFFEGLDPDRATPSPSATTGAPAPTEAPAADKTTGTGTGEPAAATAGGSTDTTPDAGSTTADDTKAQKAAEKAAEKTAEEIRAAAAEAGQTVEELDEDVKGLDVKKDEDVPDGAKQPFPCPTADPEALAAAELEQNLPLLPTDPWILESSLLTLTGLDYAGIVEVRTADGSIKKVLKFTADSVGIKDLHQMAVGPDGTTLHVEARDGSTSTIDGDTVTMYTQELKGNLFGIIPITFSPTSPPPINVPFAFFTDVKVTQAGQFGGTLKVPGLHNYLTRNAG